MWNVIIQNTEIFYYKPKYSLLIILCIYNLFVVEIIIKKIRKKLLLFNLIYYCASYIT